MQFQVNIPEGFAPTVTGRAFAVDYSKLPQAALDKIFQYGAQRIFNDAAASAKGDSAKGHAMAAKKLDALMSGVVRASRVGGGDPIRRRALELAEASVAKHPTFIAWLQANGLKQGDDEARKTRREKAVAAVEREGNPFMAQAKIDVEAASGLDLGELEL